MVAARPDVLVIIDSPELTHRIARRVRKADAVDPDRQLRLAVGLGVAARPRARHAAPMSITCSRLLPFEPQVHARLGGPPCSYVGHPLIEQLSELRPNADEAARRQADPPVLLVLPGSRAGEIRRMTAVFGEAIALLKDRAAPFEVVVPTLPQLEDSVRAATANWAVRPRIVVDPAEKRAAFRIARAALAKSGTVTLELALSGVPMVDRLQGIAVRRDVARIAIKVPSVILANLVLGENVVPEFLQRDCTPQSLADALAPLLADSPERRRQIEAFARLDTIMEIGNASPSGRAAEIVLSYATKSSSLVPAKAGTQQQVDSRCAGMSGACGYFRREIG